MEPRASFPSSLDLDKEARMTEQMVRRVSAQDLKRRMDAGEVLVFDVRKKEVFDRGHLPGARSLPIKERATWAQEILRGKAIVLY